MSGGVRICGVRYEHIGPDGRRTAGWCNGPEACPVHGRNTPLEAERARVETAYREGYEAGSYFADNARPHPAAQSWMDKCGAMEEALKVADKERDHLRQELRALRDTESYLQTRLHYAVGERDAARERLRTLREKLATLLNEKA
jgi:hypothetical protein